ncbi:MAG: DUF3576 domain-containing protein [Pseudomonadota bacterium]
MRKDFRLIASGRLVTTAVLVAALSGVAGCSGKNLASKDDDEVVRSGPERERRDPNDTLFGEDGVTIGSVNSTSLGGLLGQPGAQGDALPVNKFIWQASLDTLSFLPLSSTDPFTGVIATDWGSTPDAPGQRFKVTAYVLNPNLAASSLKVAVYRETRNEEGLWVPAPVSPDTALKLEDAILVRARQIRVASLDTDTAS